MPRPPYNEHKCYMDNHALVNNNVSRNYNSNSGASLLSVQSAGAITTSVGEEQKAASSTTATNNNVSNAVLGSLFSTGEDKLTSFNPINKTYTKVSYVGNRTIIPPDAAATATINARERGNLTFNLQPNGISLVEGKSLLVTKGGNNNGSKQENATALLIDLNGVRPHDPRSSTGVAFFCTNSTGQLAFLHNMIAIYQVKASPGGTAIRMKKPIFNYEKLLNDSLLVSILSNYSMHDFKYKNLWLKKVTDLGVTEFFLGC